MKEMLDYFQTINQMNWGGSAYQWIFYLGILLILLFEKKKSVRLVFGFLPIMFLAAIFNPVFYHAFFRLLRNPAYYVRMFSFIPLMYSIALGCTRLIGRMSGWKKCAAVLVVCSILILTGNSIYRQDWMKRAENLEKTPSETYAILDAVDDGSDSLISLAAVGAPSVYIRQIGDVITPYTRKLDELGHALEQDPPNVRWVMEEAGLRGLDYLVTNNTEGTRDAFAAEGYAPHATLNHYLIYKVENVFHTKRILNDRRQVVCIAFYNEKGELTPSNPIYTRSYVAINYEYDDHGYRSKETFLDIEGNPFYTSSGYSTVIKRNSPTGLLKTLLYCDENEQPVMISGRYETRYDNDIYGRVTRESYYDENGQLMNRTDTGYAAEEYRYTGNSWSPSVTTYLDKNAQPVISAYGYAGISRDYDDQERVVRETYLDVEGKPMMLQAGYSSLLREYIDDGMSYTETYTDTEGNQVEKYDGYASAEYQKLSDATITDVKFTDQHGKPVAFALNSLSIGVTNTGGHTYGLTTNVEGNLFDCMQIVLWDMNNKSWIHVATKAEMGVCEGEYLHEAESGYYRLNFKGNTNKGDEGIEYIVYLKKGKRYSYHFRVYQLGPRFIKTSELIWW